MRWHNASDISPSIDVVPSPWRTPSGPRASSTGARGLRRAPPAVQTAPPARAGAARFGRRQRSQAPRARALGACVREPSSSPPRADGSRESGPPAALPGACVREPPSSSPRAGWRRKSGLPAELPRPRAGEILDACEAELRRPRVGEIHRRKRAGAAELPGTCEFRRASSPAQGVVERDADGGKGRREERKVSGAWTLEQVGSGLATTGNFHILPEPG
ncbi:uncharacterized protein LOC112892340 [Panicum hallii]|uniref:uncharacterized protein LOC112892340 n=1 Tax=Panicum hallii TaxID=206008 RepID=UPI000DF4E4A1|nr:uncharacterized protein LOC112892340 [Panicum hallii]